MIGGRNADVPDENQVTYRIGINIGDVIVEDNGIYGDGLNVAARIEGLAEPSDRIVHNLVTSFQD